jgi:hypothetical protein
VTFGREDPLSGEGVEVPLSGYKCFDNPYTQVDFGSLQYVIEYNGLRLKLDFEKGIRESDS